MTQYYGLRVSTILNAADKLTADLEYLCSVCEKPDPEFPIADALIYARALTLIATHLDFIMEEITERGLSADQEYVKLSEEDVITLNAFSDATEAAVELLEERCGISLQNN